MCKKDATVDMVLFPTQCFLYTILLPMTGWLDAPSTHASQSQAQSLSQCTLVGQ